MVKGEDTDYIVRGIWRVAGSGKDSGHSRSLEHCMVRDGPRDLLTILLFDDGREAGKKQALIPDDGCKPVTTQVRPTTPLQPSNTHKHT